MSVVLFLRPYGFLFSAGELPQDVFGKRAAAEFALSLTARFRVPG
jgi:hypothetical protein